MTKSPWVAKKALFDTYRFKIQSNGLHPVKGWKSLVNFSEWGLTFKNEISIRSIEWASIYLAPDSARELFSTAAVCLKGGRPAKAVFFLPDLTNEMCFQ